MISRAVDPCSKTSLSLRGCRADICGATFLELVEVLLEETTQLAAHAFELRLILPSLVGHQDLGVHVGAARGHLQVEPGEVLVAGLGQVSRVNGINDGTRVLTRRASKNGKVKIFKRILKDFKGF